MSTSQARLQEVLELIDAQQGFAGTTGTVWIVDPDGHFRIRAFRNEEFDQPHKAGRLDGVQLRSLSQVMSSENFVDLPAEIGEMQGVNPRKLTIRFGKKETSLSFAAGRSLSEAALALGAERKDPEARFLRIANAIIHQLQSAQE